MIDENTVINDTQKTFLKTCLDSDDSVTLKTYNPSKAIHEMKIALIFAEAVAPLLKEFQMNELDLFKLADNAKIRDQNNSVNLFSHLYTPLSFCKFAKDTHRLNPNREKQIQELMQIWTMPRGAIIDDFVKRIVFSKTDIEEADFKGLVKLLEKLKKDDPQAEREFYNKLILSIVKNDPKGKQIIEKINNLDITNLRAVSSQLLEQENPKAFIDHDDFMQSYPNNPWRRINIDLGPKK